MAGGAAAAAAAAAAASRQRQLEEEEEAMTSYSADDSRRDWEFKIVRANRPLFREPKHLNRLLEEEARSGWTMVEKFDDQRIRFKRLRQPGVERPADGIDPYRTHYGISTGAYTTLVVLAALALTLGLMALVFFIAR